MLKHQIKVAQSLLSSLAAGGRGTSGTPHPIQPDKILKLYEFEGSPFCRRVREVLTTLNIDYLFKHYGHSGKTPKKYSHYPKIPVAALAGTIINGARGVWVNQAILQREAPQQLLELWGFEASPFTRIVRAELTELELPYKFHNAAKERWQDQGPAVLRLKPGKYTPLAGGKREQVLKVMGNNIQVPYLVDPNTGVKLFESAEIVKYLKQQYGLTA